MAKRDYKNEYPSVTDALNVLRKIGLEMWFKYNTAADCDAKSAKGKQVGSDTHELIEKHINAEKLTIDTEYPDEVTTALKSFMLFKSENPQIKLEASEMPLTSEIYRYNGTMDAIATINGKKVLFDWKTGEAKEEKAPKIYEEYLFQVSAYAFAYNEAVFGDVQSAIIVSLAKDKVAYNMLEIGKDEILEYFNDGFLPALTICKLQRRMKERKALAKKQAKDLAKQEKSDAKL